MLRYLAGGGIGMARWRQEVLVLKKASRRFTGLLTLGVPAGRSAQDCLLAQGTVNI